MKTLIVDKETLILSGDDFHNRNLVDNDYAYHRKLKTIGIVSNYDSDVDQWDFTVDNLTSKRDSYLLFKVLYNPLS